MSFLIGLAAGVFGGLVGLGGGILMIPMMVGNLHLTQHKAHGTSLVALVFTGLAGAATYALRSHVDVSSALTLAVAALWPARLGAQCCRRLSEIRLRRSFGVFLVVMAALLLVKPYIVPMASPLSGWLKIAALLVAGVVTGFLSGLLGIGGGAVMVVALVLGIGYGQHIAQGSALLAMVPAGAVGAYTHWRLANVEVRLLSGLIPGIILGAFAGGAFAQVVPEVVLRTFFAAVLLWMGVRFVVKKSQPVCEQDPGSALL